MVKVVFTSDFKKKFSKIKDKLLKEKIVKQIEKLKINPELGKPMRYSRKGTREVYISSYRLSYKIEGNNISILLLDIYHKDTQ